eukprot:CAMPEP_0177358222 /NCGR_PEP_ID=MMETSP0368-20130122/35472_1 /TAXON_ID=447022 ORGANISM="Scrippsiella hangoei-like, Strain SHHI-4" /NCGR_SAMPLE_ID=MMETSP0368 /ASSEMBLY_ACC=CAM_ASM_000363 /LENGTH=67 /DNA_ID=CAMNT_0018820663 /DNA_START=70 /DNA_END=269 /DNA_ORIENTATION=+
MHAPASKIEENAQVAKSVDTTSSSVKPSTPLMLPSPAFLMAAQMSFMLAPFSSLTVRSTTETSGVGT